jgi:hypothetical protein
VTLDRPRLSVAALGLAEQAHQLAAARELGQAPILLREKERAQPRAGAMKRDLDVAQTELEDPGELLVVELLHLTQQQDLTVARRERVERSPEAPRERLVTQTLFDRLRRLGLARGLGKLVAGGDADALGQLSQAEVRRDPEDPGPEVELLAGPADRADRPPEGLLDDVLGRGLVPEHAAGVSVESRAVLAVELGDRVEVAVTRTLGELLIGEVEPGRRCHLSLEHQSV